MRSLALIATVAIGCASQVAARPSSSPPPASAPDAGVGSSGALAVQSTDAAVASDAPYITGAERVAGITAIVQRRDDVSGCWRDLLERDPGHTPETFRVTLSVDTQGVPQAVDFTGISDARLSDCVRLRMRGHRFGPGDAVQVGFDWSLTP